MSSRFSETTLPCALNTRYLDEPLPVIRRSMVMRSPYTWGRKASCPVFHSVTATLAPFAPFRIRCFAVPAWTAHTVADHCDANEQPAASNHARLVKHQRYVKP